MAAELLDDRNRAFGLAGAIFVHALAIAALLLLRSPARPVGPVEPSLVAVPLREAPPPPAPQPPDRAAEPDEPAPPSRGANEAPSPPVPRIVLAPPVAAEPSVDPGSGVGSGSGAAPGSGAGPGGSGEGGGAATPPVRIAGALTNADYRRTRPPEGAAGTVVVSYRIRADGAVDRCRVLRSSGFVALDDATCRLIERRFRFEPARDGGGRAIDWEVRTDYTWRPRD